MRSSGVYSGLLLCAAVAVSSAHPPPHYGFMAYFRWHHLFSQASSANQAPLPFFRTPLPSVATAAPAPAVQADCPQVQTVRAMTELRWLNNDHNLDGVLDKDDVTWDATAYNTQSGDICRLDNPEAVDHAMCEYSYSQAYATAYQDVRDINHQGYVNWFRIDNLAPFTNTRTRFSQGDYKVSYLHDYKAFMDFCAKAENTASAFCVKLKTEITPDFMAQTA